MSGESPPATSDAGWSAYHEATRHRPPRPLLVEALALNPGPGTALDLGAGAGNDARHLLDRGWRVTAVDASPSAAAALRGPGHPRLEVIEATFASYHPPPASFDLVSAQYALPFTPPGTFDDVFARCVAALRPGGLLAVILFGVRDGWNTPGTRLTFHTRDEAERLLDGLDVVALREVEGPVTLASGDAHHGHVVEIIARMPPAPA